MRHDGATAGAGGAIEWPRGSFFQVLYTLRLAAGEMENLSDVKLWLLVVANPSQCFNVCGLKYVETIICLFTPAAFFLHTGSLWGPCRCQTPAAPKLLEGHWVAHTTNLRMSTLTIYRAPYPTELQEFNVSQPPQPSQTFASPRPARVSPRELLRVLKSVADQQDLQQQLQRRGQWPGWNHT